MTFFGKFFKQFFEGSQRQIKEVTKVKITTHFRGAFGEPYCSENCYQLSGEDCGKLYIEKFNLHNCMFCGHLIHLFSTIFSNIRDLEMMKSAYPIKEGLAFPIPGHLKCICKDCLPKAKALVSTMTECCYCGKSLEVSQDKLEKNV